MCVAELIDRDKAEDLMLILSLNETMDQLAVENRAH